MDMVGTPFPYPNEGNYLPLLANNPENGDLWSMEQVRPFGRLCSFLRSTVKESTGDGLPHRSQTAGEKGGDGGANMRFPREKYNTIPMDDFRLFSVRNIPHYLPQVPIYRIDDSCTLHSNAAVLPTRCILAQLGIKLSNFYVTVSELIWR